MRLVFIGSSEFGLKCLQTCLEIQQIKIVGVVTAPKVFTISYNPKGIRNVLHADMSGLAEKNEIPVVTLQTSMSDPLMLRQVTEWKPDAFLVAGWYHMIPQSWRNLAPAFGLHASLLPDYSGGAPLVWAMINGETKTGITFFKMDAGVDSGPIGGQREEYIFHDDTIATLGARIERQGLNLLHEVLPKLVNGTLALRLQDESQRRVMAQRSPKDGRINWNQDAQKIIRFIRAQTKPYPGAFTIFKGKKLHIWAAENAHPMREQPIGRVQRTTDGRFIVCCNEGAITLTEISFDSRTYKHAELVHLFGERSHELMFF